MLVFPGVITSVLGILSLGLALGAPVDENAIGNSHFLMP
jgi:hypothetical protein